MQDITPRDTRRQISFQSRTAMNFGRSVRANPTAATSQQSAQNDTPSTPKVVSRVAAYGFLCCVLLFELVAVALLPMLTNNDKFYALNDQVQAIVGESEKELVSKLTYDGEKKIFQYNKDAAPAGAPDSPEAAIATAQNSQKVGGGANNYTVDVAEDPAQGVTIRDATDTTGTLAVQMIPQFAARDGKQKEGRLVYPLIGMDGHLVYTVKGNGLKEDIVLNEFQGDELSFSYKLVLPEALEARPLSDGSIGIYSADTTLFGNISFGSDADREKVDLARKNSEKTHLAFTIPAPIIVQNGEQKDGPTSRFELKGDILTVVSTNLSKASYPLSIDPSIVVTSANDFARGNLESGVEIDGAGHIRRAGLTGGAVGSSWPSAYSGSPFTTARHSHGAIAYNNFIYIFGGTDGTTNFSDVQYAPINSNGTIGAWTAAPSFSGGRHSFGYGTHNGYIYIVAGAGGSVLSESLFAKIRQDGSLDNSLTSCPGGGVLTNNTWCTSTAYPAARDAMGMTIHNGYIYATGGDNNVNRFADTYYAPLNANGTIGAWVLTSSFATVRSQHSSHAVNDKLYIAGGVTNLSQLLDVQFAYINPDGSLKTDLTACPEGGTLTNATWCSTTSINDTVGRNFNAMWSMSGYMYVAGGITNTTFSSGVIYAQIRPDGTLGAWQSTTALPVTASALRVVAYKGYIYTTGGETATNVETNAAYMNQPQEAGLTRAYTTDGGTSFATGRYSHTTVAYNGYIYIIGGYNGTYLGDVQYAPLNADGSVGTWVTDGGTSFTNARVYHASVVFNGYLYVIGGYDNTNQPRNDVQYAPLNADGSVGTWVTDGGTSFTGPRYTHASIVNNGYLYVVSGCTAGGIGGCNAGSYQNDVQYAPLNADGSVGTWVTDGGGNFTNVRNFPGLEIVNGYMYIAGGLGPSSVFYNDVQFAAVNADGSIGSWATTTSFTNPRYGHTLNSYKGYLYLAGGITSSNTFLSDVQKASINSDGTLQSWSSMPSFTTGRFGHTATISGDYMYVLGGCAAILINCTDHRTDVQYAGINNGGLGTTSSWSASTPTGFGNPRYGVASVAHNGFLYAIGGFDSVTTFNTTYYAPITSNGTVGAWTAANTIPASRYFPTVNVHNGYMYVVGGRAAGAGLTSTVYYALICTGQNNGIGGCGATPGTVGTWGSTTALPNTRAFHATATANGYLYVAGGCISTGLAGECTNTLNNVIYALICTGQNNGIGGCGATPGTLGTWTTSPNTFTTARNSASLLAANGYLYLVAGCNTACNTTFNDVQVSKINSDGTLNTWFNTTPLPEARYSMAAYVYSGNLYVAGGAINATPIGTTRYAPLLTNGTLGEWSRGQSLVTARLAAGGAVYRGRLYVVAGGTNASFTSGTFRQDIEIAGIQSIDRRGTYSYQYDLAGNAVATKLLYRGQQNTDSLGVSYKNALTGSGYGNTTSLFNTASNSLINLARSEQRYRLLTFTLDDSANATFPDNLGSATSLEDFELFFHAATDASGSKRLRGGKTFTTETQRSLDAQPQ